MTSADAEGIRLQKVLAQAGVTSRRNAEIMIDEGRVEVNGEVVMEQGRRVDPDRDAIRVDGKRIPPPRRHAYYVFNKPRGVVSTMDDDQDRASIAHYTTVPNLRKLALRHVGRLDTDTEGMLFLSNDGDFINRVTHPSYELQKTYVAEVSGVVDKKLADRLKKGIMLDDGPIKADRVKVGATSGNKTMVTIVLHSGRNHIVRRIFEAVGHPVRALTRVQIGPVKMGQLKVGEMRELTSDELGALLDAVKL
ncbi:pseudouridine synthase [Propioniciclava tarda]|uniref:RNA pseudouridylate synthase n=1 Tax=Propioniciclava tarda TaxID=433330 RepID=A0A4Q9KJC7_PROTD|nr:pseudouridine synthase [Propioniciclava tarda]TBT94552.1 rRNA pseudouridine synthase [Propioniciclava tarda]SMO68575.1 23S rRNA pseudouridine2605 synthase [Propioniciclava tarda]HQD59641.1 pseudouridine synthase [Propioniciclava tarda]